MKHIYEIREVSLTSAGLQYGRTIDARKLITDAAVLCVRLNARAQGTSFRYVYQSHTV